MVDVSQPSIMDNDTLVANDGAMASYSCVEGYMLDGEISTLECVAMNDTVNLVWYPSAPSACVESKLMYRYTGSYLGQTHQSLLVGHQYWQNALYNDKINT